MANNRMYLACLKCLEEEDTKWEDCVFYMAKYYPSTGWYINQEKLDLESFYDRHNHETLAGDYFQIIYENQFSQLAKDKMKILETIMDWDD